MGAVVVQIVVGLFIVLAIGVAVYGVLSVPTRAVLLKELHSYFDSPIAYIFMIVFLLSTGVAYAFFIRGGWLSREMSQVQMDTFFTYMPLYLCLVVPAMTMRAWSEEKRSGTQELLLTWPVRDVEVVIGKYLAAAGLLGFTVLLTLPIAWRVDMLAESEGLDWAVVSGYYLGTVMMGAMFTAVGVCLSSLSRDQIVAFMITVVVLATACALGLKRVLEEYPVASPYLRAFSPMARFERVASGVIDSRDVLYFLSGTTGFLVLNLFVVSARKWRA